MTAADIHTGGPTGAPDVDVDELVENAVAAAWARPMFPRMLRTEKVTSIAQEVIGSLNANGCIVVTPSIFVPQPNDFVFEAYGVALAELGDDGETIIALGHVKPRRMLAAMNRYWRKHCGLNYRDITGDEGHERPPMVDQVKHRWAEFTRNTADTDSAFEFSWMCWPAPAPHLDVHHRAVPITRWELS